MSQAGPVGVRMFGSHHEYEGDQPWWTLRFNKALSNKQKVEVAAFLEQSNANIDGICSPLIWKSARQCQWETCDPWFPNQKAWDRFYEQVDKVFIALHEAFPLFAIFLQEGQFHDHEGLEESLTELSDEQLAAL